MRVEQGNLDLERRIYDILSDPTLKSLDIPPTASFDYVKYCVMVFLNKIPEIKWDFVLTNKKEYLKVQHHVEPIVWEVSPYELHLYVGTTRNGSSCCCIQLVDPATEKVVSF